MMDDRDADAHSDIDLYFNMHKTDFLKSQTLHDYIYNNYHNLELSRPCGGNMD